MIAFPMAAASLLRTLRKPFLQRVLLLLSMGLLLFLASRALLNAIRRGAGQPVSRRARVEARPSRGGVPPKLPLELLGPPREDLDLLPGQSELVQLLAVLAVVLQRLRWRWQEARPRRRRHHFCLSPSPPGAGRGSLDQPQCSLRRAADRRAEHLARQLPATGRVSTHLGCDVAGPSRAALCGHHIPGAQAVEAHRGHPHHLHAMCMYVPVAHAAPDCWADDHVVARPALSHVRVSVGHHGSGWAHNPLNG